MLAKYTSKRPDLRVAVSNSKSTSNSRSTSNRRSISKSNSKSNSKSTSKSRSTSRSRKNVTRSHSRRRDNKNKTRHRTRSLSKRRTATTFFEELYGTKFSPKISNGSPEVELPLEWEEKFRRDASLQRKQLRSGYVTPPELKHSLSPISSREKKQNIQAFLANFDSK